MSDRPPCETRPAVVRVRGLNHHFGSGPTRHQVLFDNELDVLPGEIVIMTGPSGSGKTTLLTLIGGLRSIQQGSIRVLGRELAQLDAAGLVQARRSIGFIFQSHNLLTSLSAIRNVRMALELTDGSSDDKHRRARTILETLGLGERLHHKPHALSGGQRQRVAIARALVHQPRLILADEPTAALDEVSGRQVMTLLRQLAQDHGCTSLIVTHDPRILKVADRIVNMVGGRIRSNVLLRESLAICEDLRRCVAFAGLSPDALAQIVERMTRHCHPPGTVLVRQGECCTRFVLIRHGTIDIIRSDATGERIVGRLGPGDFFGERSLMLREPKRATYRTHGPAETLALDSADFHEALAVSAPVVEQVRRLYFSQSADRAA